MRFVGQNERMWKPYVSVYLDGFDEFEYKQVFQKAWEVSLWAPLEQRWASWIETLLRKAAMPEVFDVETAIKRWRIDEDSTKNYNVLSSSWFLRTRLADVLPADEYLFNQEDVALRCSFYRRFSPTRFPHWCSFFERDRNEFLSACVGNENIWQDANARSLLGSLVWRADDPYSDMEFPNTYRSMEQKFRTAHPAWFEAEDV